MKTEIRLAQTEFQPGETINGTALWQGEKDIQKAEVRLFWRTEGKGTRDVQTVATEPFELPCPSDERAFSFVAPAVPWSFSGRLISLVWGIDLVVEPGEPASRVITIAPGRSEVVIDRPEWIEVGGAETKAAFFRFGP